MNDPSMTAFSDEQLDRLVDGELSSDEYRQLLELIDQEPDGWRRCAAAFLEAQAWGHDLRASTSAAPLATENPERGGPAPATSKLGLSSFALAIAASLVAAFGLGTLWTDRQPTVDPIVSSENPEQPAIGIAGATPSPRQSPENLTDQPWGEVTLVMDGASGTTKEVELPVYRARQARDRWADALPKQIRSDLREMGFEVRRDVHWAPIELDRGGRVLVPLNEIEIVPVSQNLFQ